MAKSKIHKLLVKKLYSIKHRCEKRILNRRDDLKVTLTLEDMKFMWERDNAHLLKSPSVDRIDDDVGYELSNCRFIEAWINKGQRSEETKQQLIKWSEIQTTIPLLAT